MMKRSYRYGNRRKEMDTTTRVEILDEAVYLTFRSLEKGMNLILLSHHPDMGK